MLSVRSIAQAARKRLNLRNEAYSEAYEIYQVCLRINCKSRGRIAEFELYQFGECLPNGAFPPLSGRKRSVAWPCYEEKDGARI